MRWSITNSPAIAFVGLAAVGCGNGLHASGTMTGVARQVVAFDQAGKAVQVQIFRINDGPNWTVEHGQIPNSRVHGDFVLTDQSGRLTLLPDEWVGRSCALDGIVEPSSGPSAIRCASIPDDRLPLEILRVVAGPHAVASTATPVK